MPWDFLSQGDHTIQENKANKQTTKLAGLRSWNSNLTLYPEHRVDTDISLPALLPPKPLRSNGEVSVLSNPVTQGNISW